VKVTWCGAEGKVSVLDQMDDFKLNQRYLVCRAIERVTFHALHKDFELVLLKCVKNCVLGGGGAEEKRVSRFTGFIFTALLEVTSMPFRSRSQRN
jgi:hypothetical protein